MTNFTQNRQLSANNGPSTHVHAPPYSPHTNHSDTTVDTTMDNAPPALHCSAASAVLCSTFGQLSATLPSSWHKASITPTIDHLSDTQHPSTHHGRLQPLRTFTPTPMLTHATTTTSLPHTITTKTTEKSYISLHNLHGNSTTNHHHRISPVTPVSSIHHHTMDQSTSIVTPINSHPPVHLTATLKPGTLTSLNNNHFSSPIPHCPHLPFQRHQKKDTTVDYITTVTALIPNEPTAVPATHTSNLPTEVSASHA